MSDTDVAVNDNGTYERVTWSGSAFSIVGSGAALTNVLEICSLSENRIAGVVSTTLYVFKWDGSTWVQEYTRTYGSAAIIDMIALSSGQVIGSSTGIIRNYTITPRQLTQLGVLTASSWFPTYMSALNANEFIATTGSYDSDGASNWDAYVIFKAGTGIPSPAVYVKSISTRRPVAINPSSFVCLTGDDNYMPIYKIERGVGTPERTTMAY